MRLQPLLNTLDIKQTLTDHFQPQRLPHLGESCDRSFLVIGYGNTLRGDDGVGYQVAEAVAAWAITQMRAQAVHQLLPELVGEIADSNTVIFVDAILATDSTLSNIKIEPLEPRGEQAVRSHILTPQVLLGLTQRLYGVTPTAYLLTIPAVDLTLGATLSPLAARGKALALEYLRDVAQVGVPLAQVSNGESAGIAEIHVQSEIRFWG